MVALSDEARAFLAEAVKVSGLKPSALARKAGVASSTITRPLNNSSYKFTPKTETMAKVAAAVGRRLPEIFSSAGIQSEPRLVAPIQAGAWLLYDDGAHGDRAVSAAVLDRRYPHAAQWLREVRGDAMDARGIVAGDIAHIVDLAESRVNLNTGMIVEVIRLRDGGALREVTLKEIEVTPQGLLLWSRSTNPKWNDPVRLDGDTGSGVEVEVTGLLLQSVKRFI